MDTKGCLMTRKPLNPAQRALQDAGKSLAQCARLLSVSERTLARWLSANHVPVCAVAEQLAWYLGVPAGTFHRTALLREREEER